MMPLSTRLVDHEQSSQPWSQLHNWLHHLLARPSAAEADAWALSSLTRFSDLVSRTGESAANGNRAADEVIHLALAKLYDLFLCIPKHDRKGPRGSAALEFAKTALEREALKAWPSSPISDYPHEPAAFVKALAALARSHSVANHPFYTVHLARAGSRADLRSYFIQELSVDGRFDDMIALLQLGTSGTMKMEFARNFWDEMGCGEIEDVHTDLFARVIAALDITPEEIARSTTHESRVCGNFSVMLASRRDLFYRASGYFGVMEFLVPQRMRDVLTCWERHALDPAAVKYHRVHMSVDDRHAAGWFSNVIEPMVAAHPAVGAEIMAGAMLRMNTSQQYLDRLVAGSEL